jgi:hypothetical protein
MSCGTTGVKGRVAEVRLEYGFARLPCARILIEISSLEALQNTSVVRAPMSAGARPVWTVVIIKL